MSPATAACGTDMSDHHALARFVIAHPRLVVLTGAGVSTASGIPGYRDASGQWRHRLPVTHQQFVSDPAVRKRYWARSLVGWPRIAAATPNAAHVALAALERAGHVAMLVTQNVDRLHERAGSQHVIDLHGRLDQVVCLDCARTWPRAHVQATLAATNAAFLADVGAVTLAPDGDADVMAGFAGFRVPVCAACGGTLKPDVVFHGANVPRERVARALAVLAAADALLVAGSSLAVYSGFRFCVQAQATGIPIAIVNQGSTRADALATLRVDDDCGAALSALVLQLAAPIAGTANVIVDA